MGYEVTQVIPPAPTPVFVADAASLEALARRLEAEPRVALDTESNMNFGEGGAGADGQHAAIGRLEQALSHIAQGLVQAGVGQLIVAGGETSGACVQRLGITQMRIGPQIDPGVPWCHATTPVRAAGLHLALKSGNFGGTDFFSRAFQRL